MRPSSHITPIRTHGRDFGAAIVRDSQTKAASLEIKIDQPFELFAGRQANRIDYARPILSADRSGIYPLEVSCLERSYFVLRAGQNQSVLAERLLPISGGFNFRDLGGYKNIHGQSTTWGRLFRSDDLMTLTRQDLDYLSSIPIRTVVDFRTEPERNRCPDLLPGSVNRHVFLPIKPGSIELEEFQRIHGPDQARLVMLKVYEQFINDEITKDAYRAFFALVQDESNLPVLFHCSAGKDRTGLAAAFILFSLAVDKLTVMEDYMASYDLLKAKYPQRSGIFMVDPKYLQTAENVMHRDYGSIENYLNGELSVDFARMSQLFLQPAN